MGFSESVGIEKARTEWGQVLGSRDLHLGAHEDQMQMLTVPWGEGEGGQEERAGNC